MAEFSPGSVFHEGVVLDHSDEKARGERREAYLQRAETVVSANRALKQEALDAVTARLQEIATKLDVDKKNGLTVSSEEQQRFDALTNYVERLKEKNEGEPTTWKKSQQSEWDRVLKELVELDELGLEPSSSEQQFFDNLLNQQQDLTRGEFARAQRELAEVDAWIVAANKNPEMKINLGRLDILSDLFLEELKKLTDKLVAEMKQFVEENGLFSSDDRLVKAFAMSKSESLQQFNSLIDLARKTGLTAVYGRKANIYGGGLNVEEYLNQCAFEAQTGGSSLDFRTTYSEVLPLSFIAQPLWERKQW